MFYILYIQRAHSKSSKIFQTGTLVQITNIICTFSQLGFGIMVLLTVPRPSTRLCGSPWWEGQLPAERRETQRDAESPTATN